MPLDQHDIVSYEQNTFHIVKCWVSVGTEFSMKTTIASVELGVRTHKTCPNIVDWELSCVNGLL